MACGRYCALGEGRREGEREEKERARDGERMGDGLGGGRTGITIKQPLTAHTTPEQLTEELQQWVGAGGGGGGRANVQPQQKCASERHVKQRGDY